MSDSNAQPTYALFANPANRKIISELEKSGADVILFPPIKTEKLALEQTNIEKIKNLNRFDWLIFPDVMAVDYFLEMLAEYAIDLFDLDSMRVCSIGESVADRLRFSAVHTDVIPQTVDVEDVVAAVIDYAGKSRFAELRFLIPGEISMENDLSEKLQNKGASVCEMPIYTVGKTRDLETTKLKTLLAGGAVDEFIFTAPTDFIALKHYFKNRKISDVFAEIKVSAGDDSMLRGAKEHNLERAGLFHFAKLGKVKM